MRRFVIAFLLAISAWPGAAAPLDDRPTFLVTFTPDGGRIVIASHPEGIKVLSVPELKELPSHFALEKGRRLKSAAISPSSRWLAADDGTGHILIWNFETGEAQPAVPVARRSRPVYVFGAGDDTLFIFHEGQLRVWDVKQGREVGVVNGVTDVEMMSASPDGHFLVVFGACSTDRTSGSVCVCAIDEAKVVAASKWEYLFTAPRPVIRKPSDILHLTARPPLGKLSAADLVYTKDDQILLTLRGEESTYQSRLLKPNLQVLETISIEPEQQWRYPGNRSTPGDHVAAISADGQWRATASERYKKLYLHRVTPDRPVLEKFISIP